MLYRAKPSAHLQAISLAVSWYCASLALAVYECIIVYKYAIAPNYVICGNRHTELTTITLAHVPRVIMML